MALSPFLRSVFFSFLLLACASLAACQKDDASPEAATAKLLVGRWELVQSSGGIAGGTYPADPARKQEIVFGSNGQADFLLNGAVTSTTPYSLTQATSYITGKTQIFVKYGSSSTGSRSFIQQISPFILSISDDNPDGISATYKRN